jgi:hypothetical protein
MSRFFNGVDEGVNSEVEGKGDENEGKRFDPFQTIGSSGGEVSQRLL